jgi:hypothetical protein
MLRILTASDPGNVLLAVPPSFATPEKILKSPFRILQTDTILSLIFLD